MDSRIDGLQKTANKVQNVYKKLVGPIISIIVPAALIGAVVYLALGGAFNIGDLADHNNVVRIPVVFLVVALPIGWLIEVVGVTAGLSIISALLGLWLILGVVTLVKRIKQLKSAE
ncbi:MAG: hypothetical protein LBL55_05685 [Propionibacteriaceae bacterium]|jgi:hypothetical protein|nr:hypothetical protein [Propionibacteriaceae bacterium]